MRPLYGHFTATLRSLCGHSAADPTISAAGLVPKSLRYRAPTSQKKSKKKQQKKTKEERKKKKKKTPAPTKNGRRRPARGHRTRRRDSVRFFGFFCFFVCLFFSFLSLSLSFTRGAFPVSLEILTEPHTAVLFRRRSFVFFVCRFARFLLLDVLLFCYFAQSASGSAGLPGPSPSWPSSRPSYGSWNELWANRNERNVKIDTKPKEKNDEEIVRE